MNEANLKIAAAAVIGACVVIVTGFFSVSVAAVLGGFLAVCLALGINEDRRGAWEGSIDQKIERLEKSQDAVGKAVMRANEEILELKNASKNKDIPKEIVKPSLAIPANANSPVMIAPEVKPEPQEKTQGKPERVILSKPLRFEDISDSALSDEGIRRLARRAIESDGVEMFLQPILRLPQRKIRYYEMFARLRARPGYYLPAAQYMKVTGAEDTRGIERILLMDCLEMIKDTANIDRAVPFFVNISGDTLKSPLYIQKLLNFMGSRRNLAARIVFEMPQRDVTLMAPASIKMMQSLGTLGCGFSMDNVRDLNIDAAEMARRKVQFVKIPAKILLERARAEKTFAEILRLKRRLDNSGIAMIAEKVESEKDLKDLLDFDISYGQGFLFGKPDLQAAYQRGKMTARG
jgi:cyclic-di-GMP phosphodiesterase TipF (flagellum assembly factor)